MQRLKKRGFILVKDASNREVYLFDGIINNKRSFGALLRTVYKKYNNPLINKKYKIKVEINYVKS